MQRILLPVAHIQKAILKFVDPQGRHVAPMEVKFGVEESTFDTPCHISSPPVQWWGPKNWKFYPVSEYKRHAEAYPLSDFNEIFRVCEHHHGC